MLMVAPTMLTAALLTTGATTAEPDTAASPTSTGGRICHSDGYGTPACGARSVKTLRTFVSYYFVGKTKGADGGTVRFEYRKRGSKQFHSIGNYRNTAARPFFTQRDHPVDQVTKSGRWEIDFAPGMPGKFTLRARFTGTDNASPSDVRRRVKVVGNE